MHRITVGTYGSLVLMDRAQVKRGAGKLGPGWTVPPSPARGGGLVRLLLLFSLTVFLFLFVWPTLVLKSVPSGHPYGLLSSEPEVSQWSRSVVVISCS